MQTSRQKWEAYSFFADRIQTGKNCQFFYFRKTIFYTLLAFIKQEFVKYNTQIDLENIQKLMTYLVHY